MDVTNTSAGRLVRGIVVLATVCAVNACRYDQPITPGDLSDARDRGTILNASLMVDACLSLPATVTLSGPQSSSYQNLTLLSNADVDARTAQFKVSDPMDPADFDPFLSVSFVRNQSSAYSNICWSGGEILGQYSPSTYYWSVVEDGASKHGMHDKYGMLPGHDGAAPAIQIEDVTIFNYGDGISFDNADANNFILRNVHIKYGRDDCIENDSYLGGTIDGAFLDGCYSGVSARSGRPLSSNVITMSNSLVRLQSMDQVYDGGPPEGNHVGPEHNSFWKWNSNAPKLKLYNNVFRVDGPQSGDANDHLVPLESMLVPGECQNNKIIWLGSGSFPEQLPFPAQQPACFTVYTQADGGLTIWDNAVAQWQTAHPSQLSDAAPPIVSMFRPGLTGPTSFTDTVTLVATAVDDRTVTSVQFKMTPTGGGSPYNIGAGVTVQSEDASSANGYAGPTKYRLVSWNSALVPNGTYTLTAVAEDGVAGHAKTSDGVPVTVSNVAPPPPLSVTIHGFYSNQNGTIRFNELCTFRADGSGGTGTPTYTWSKNNVFLATGRFIDVNVGANGFTLKVVIDVGGQTAQGEKQITLTSNGQFCF